MSAILLGHLLLDFIHFDRCQWECLSRHQLIEGDLDLLTLRENPFFSSVFLVLKRKSENKKHLLPHSFLCAVVKTTTLLVNYTNNVSVSHLNIKSYK